MPPPRAMTSTVEAIGYGTECKKHGRSDCPVGCDKYALGCRAKRGTADSTLYRVERTYDGSSLLGTTLTVGDSVDADKMEEGLDLLEAVHVLTHPSASKRYLEVRRKGGKTRYLRLGGKDRVEIVGEEGLPGVLARILGLEPKSLVSPLVAMSKPGTVSAAVAFPLDETRMGFIRVVMAAGSTKTALLRTLNGVTGKAFKQLYVLGSGTEVEAPETDIGGAYVASTGEPPSIHPDDAILPAIATFPLNNTVYDLASGKAQTKVASSVFVDASA